MPNQGLCVITHNGKLPSQGGLRLGYGVPGLFFIKAGTTVLRAWPWTLPAKPKPIIRRAIVDLFGEFHCTHCGLDQYVGGNRPTRQIPERKVKCSRCQTEHVIYKAHSIYHS